MIHTLLRGEDVAVEDRFDQWCEIVARNLQDSDVSTQHPEGFRGSVRAVALGTVQLAELVYSPLTSRRSVAHVRRHDTQHLHIHLIIRGTTVLDLGRQQHTASAGEIQVNGSWHPYTGHALVPGGLVKQLTLSVPRPALPVPLRWTDGFLGRCPVGAGTSAVLAGLLKDTFGALDRGADLHSHEAAQLGNAALCLVSALIAHRAGGPAALPTETRRLALLQRIHAFIEAHLADPALCPQAVADAHHLSLRHLHRIFQQDGTTVSTWIRRRRLERCRQDLTDPRLAARPIHAVAARWGFAHPADFTRAFHTAYAMPPSEYRNAAMRA
ncbi:helix-turn-helix domain-containing protein [Actinocrinis puniceicyclus]|uniref:Helix-turn-helix domain-containing protein n=1 Tax=Actinocrinis puniceicyclus TaxID=977794 RepID=A0A8J8BDN1_9ACTN|nr:helix-turn-helix domain-containing protein [Actinocrinis puniceicyclus]MBS2962964.1 helix-turn-helix domain-containing protein [Actinocrinis puniceicyclus]